MSGGRFIAFIFTVLGVMLAIFFWLVPSPSPSPSPFSDREPIRIPKPVDEKINKINENETPKLIRVTGIGFAKDGVLNPTLKYEMAKLAAEGDAKRKLIERIRVKIKSVSRIENKKFSDDWIELRVKGSLSKIDIVDVKKNSDGSVEVTMEAPIDSIFIEDK